MDVLKLVRNASKIHAAMTRRGKQLVAIKPLKIYVPEAYFGKFLGPSGETLKFVGIFGLTVEDKYFGVSMADAMIETDPSHRNIVEIEEVKYMEFSYEPGDIIMTNVNIAQSGTFVYRIYYEMVANGKVPWYVQYRDHLTMFNTAKVHGGASLGVDNSILELLSAAMAKDPNDKTKYFRQSKPKAGDEPVMIALKSVAHGATNTTAKISGSNFQQGVTSALVSKSTTNESIEDLLRS